MAVSDRRPFISTLAEEETMVLYTAIPNRTNSKSVAGKHEVELIRIENNGVVDTHQEPIEPIDCLELRTDTYALPLAAAAVAHARVVVAHAQVVVAHARGAVVVRKFEVKRKHVRHPP